MSNHLYTAPLEKSPWPHDKTSNLLFLVDAGTDEERRFLTEWLEKMRPDGASILATNNLAFLGSHGRDDSPSHQSLENQVTYGEERLFVPVRIAWLTDDRSGQRGPRVRDFLFRKVSGPSVVQRKWLLRRSPEKALPIAGRAATLQEMKRKYCNKVGLSPDAPVQATDFADYVARQAILSLEQARAIQLPSPH